MSDTNWTAVEEFIVSRLHEPDETLAAGIANCAAAGLPAIAVAPPHGKLLHLLARMHGAKKVLEIGTLGGYSTTWLARALPAEGSVITLEYDPKHAKVARQNLDAAGVGEKVEIRVGAAIDSLPKLVEENAGPFDFIFIDADKPNNAAYFEWALKLTRPGSVIIVDNVVREGAILNEGSDDEAVQGGRGVIEQLAGDSRVDATVLQTVGSKGHDGMLLAIVK